MRSGRLCVEWSWCRDIHDRASIAALAELFNAALHGLVAHCLTPGVGGHTPSDFPLARLRQEDLERLERDYPDIEAAYPLSPLQQGLLFHATYDSSADPYRVQLCLDIEGALDQLSMREAWQSLLDRHESLRVAVIEQDGLPLQIVRHGLALPWREEDWSGLGEAAFQRRLAAFLDEDRTQGFDFASGPLLRVALLRRSASRWVMVLTNHHLVLDGWSLSVLLNELVTIYSQHQEGGPDILPAPRAYRDYLTWLARQDADAARAYWRQRLAGAAPLPEILDRPPGKPQGMAERRLTLSEEMVAELRGFVRRHGLTLGTLIHAAWAVVLAQYTGQKDVVFGTTVAGRPGDLAGIERMVGLFINTLPLRVSVETDAVVVDWLKELHALQLDDQRHGYASLAEIQRAADGSGGGDLFQTLVVVENYPLAAALVDGNGADRAGFRLTAASAVERTRLSADADRVAAALAGVPPQLRPRAGRRSRRHPPDRPSRARAALPGGDAGGAAVGAVAAVAGRAPDDHRGVERDGGRRAGGEPAGAVRGAGGARPRCGGGGLRRRVAQLWRARIVLETGWRAG